MTRHCCRCGREIAACNGFTIGRDQIACLNGELHIDKVRELCGRCVEAMTALDQPSRDAAIRALPHPQEHHA